MGLIVFAGNGTGTALDRSLPCPSVIPSENILLIQRIASMQGWRCRCILLEADIPWKCNPATACIPGNKSVLLTYLLVAQYMCRQAYFALRRCRP